MFTLLPLLLLALVLLVVAFTTELMRRMVRPPRQTAGVALAKGLAIDPADLQLTAEQATFSLTDGTTSPGWLIQGECETGPTAIVVHGFADSRFRALDTAKDLCPFVSQVVIFDQRGHGEAQGATSHCGTTEVDDVVGLLDQFETVRGVVLYGISFGAGVAIAAGHRDDRILGVIAEGAARTWDEPVRRWMWNRRYPTWPSVILAHWLLKLRFAGLKQFDRARHAARFTGQLLLLPGPREE